MPSVMESGAAISARFNNWIVDPEKCLRIQSQIVLLMHAHKCQHRQHHLPEGETLQCSLSNCEDTRNLIDHITFCADTNCGVPDCAWSKFILLHRKHCTNDSCNVCQPLKTMFEEARINALNNQMNQANM